MSSKLTAGDDGLSLTTYVYSSEGHLLQVDTPAQSISYRHNALGNRVAKLVDGQIVEQYLWQDLTTLLAIYDGSGQIKQRFEYTLGHTPSSFTQSGQRYFIQSDHLGSPRVITDNNGNVIKTLNYDSYGNIIHDSNPALTIPFGFAGGSYDADTGLIRFGFRDYDPETGRWTARDPIGFAGGDTNLYGYVLGDPVNYVDPNGLRFKSSESASSNAMSFASSLAYHHRSPHASIVYRRNESFLSNLFGSSSPYNRTSPSHATVTGKYYYDNRSITIRSVSNLKGTIQSGVIAFPRFSVTPEEALRMAQIMANEIGAPVSWMVNGGAGLEGVVFPETGSCLK